MIEKIGRKKYTHESPVEEKKKQGESEGHQANESKWKKERNIIQQQVEERNKLSMKKNKVRETDFRQMIERSWRKKETSYKRFFSSSLQLSLLFSFHVFIFFFSFSFFFYSFIMFLSVLRSFLILSTTFSFSSFPSTPSLSLSLSLSSLSLYLYLSLFLSLSHDMKGLNHPTPVFLQFSSNYLLSRYCFGHFLFFFNFWVHLTFSHEFNFHRW